MANSYNSNPIVIDTAMASGWRALQTLNTGTMPTGYAGSSVTTAAAQPGIRAQKVMWVNIVAAGHTFVILDPNDSTVLLQGQAGSTIADQLYFDPRSGTWRDFKVSQISSGQLLIYYRT